MLKDRRVYHARIRGFKVAGNILSRVPVLRTTRANRSPLLKYNTIHAASYERSLEVVVARAWNALSPENRSIEQISVFKKEMKDLMFKSIPKNTVNLYLI